MIKTILFPSRKNSIIWITSIYLLFLLYNGKVSGLTILFVYFIETIIIGMFNVVKMFIILKFGEKEKNNKFMLRYGLILFFIVHYGFFIAVQSIFGFTLFEIEGSVKVGEPFNLIENYTNLLSFEGIKYALPVIFFNHMSWFVLGFLREKRYNYFTAKEILFKPYLRIFIQQFVVILSVALMLLTKQAILVGIVLILLRLFVDLALEAIKLNSKLLDFLAEKMANEKTPKEAMKRQLIIFSE